MVDDRGRLPLLRADPNQPGAFHRRSDGLPRDRLPVRVQVGEDPRRPVNLVGVAVETADLLVDGLAADSTLGGLPIDPDVVTRPGHLKQAHHAGDREVGLPTPISSNGGF